MNASSVSFKKLTTDRDWDIFLDIENKAASQSPYYFALKDRDEAKKIVGNSVVYLLYVGDKAIGHVEYEMQGNEAEFTGFVILPEYRKKGYGKLLFEKAMEDIKTVPLVYLMTHPENSVALRIYLAFGFTIVAWKDNFYGNGQPRLRLELRHA